MQIMFVHYWAEEKQVNLCVSLAFLWARCQKQFNNSQICLSSFSVDECCVSVWMKASVAPVFHAYLFLGSAIWLITFRRLRGILAHFVLDLN